MSVKQSKRDYLDRLERMAQGPATPATEEDLRKEETGFTNRHLHRRIDPKQKSGPFETKPRSYKLTIGSLYTFLSTHIHTHVEEENPDFHETCYHGHDIGEREIP